MLTAKLPRVSLAQLPTPLDEMPNLRKALGENCPRLFIKRDDQTGLATGGNKARKLEFLVADALAKGADTLITTAAGQSNTCRQVAAAAAKMGLRSVLLLAAKEVPKDQWNGNLLLDALLGADVRWIGEVTPEESIKIMDQVTEDLRKEGRKPYIVALGGSQPTGDVGFVVAIEELAEQLKARNIKADRIVMSTGSGGTQAGMVVGVKALGMDIKVDGMDDYVLADMPTVVRNLCVELAKYLDLDLTFTAEDIIIRQPGKHPYSAITEAEREALFMVGQYEGVILDPIYTGRAFGELIHMIRRGVYKRDETVIFWHTGGTAGLFARAADVMAR